ncbi:MAG TPA: pitrilysin family protein [Methylomirabilota bacterium]|nr:pitrilysin family protein [Methylomirabilota bacterium]
MSRTPWPPSRDRTPRASRLPWPALAVLVTLVLLVLAGVLASPAQSPAPTPSPGATFTAGIRETTLPNGLKVLTKEVRSAPVVSFSVWYKVGSRNEHTGITGVSHLLEHMMFKGTKRYAVGEIARTLFLNGAAFNASTYYDWTNYWETIASDRLELAMAIEADRMAHSRIDKTDLDAEMTVVRSELEGGENNPGRLLWQAVAATAFQAHPYHWPVIGWRSDVENVPRDAIHHYYKTHYGPNTATVVIVGDVDAAEALRLVGKHFGPLARIPVPPPVYTAEPPQRGERRVTVRRAGSLPMVMTAYKGPAASHPDFYALDVLAMVLGEGRTSRLYQGLVEKQLASSADAGAPSLKDPFLIYLSATARPGVPAEKLEAALLEEVERVKAAPITDEELARATRRIEADFVFQTDSVSAQARQIGYWAMVDDWRYLATYLDRIRALTPAGIQAIARKYLVPDARTVGYFIPTTEGGEAAPPPKEASARVEKPRRGDRLIPLPKPSKTAPVSRQIARFTLDNGIRVVVQENPANPTLALRASVPAGSIVEPRDTPGLASLTASMLTRGTATRSALEFATVLENVGARLDATANTLTTMISGRAQSKDFELVLDLLADMLTRPAFPAEDLERLKGRALAGLSQEKTSPDRLASRAFERAIYPPGHPLRAVTVEEAEEAIKRATREDLEQFYRRQYGPDRMILVVTGDVKADRVRQGLAARLGAWPRNPQATPLPAPDVPLQDKPETLVIRVPDRSQTAILWGHAGGLRRSDPDFYATQVLNLILGGAGALNSRLGNIIRDEQGLAYNVYSFFDANLYPGPFEAALGTNPANARKAIGSLEAEIRRMREKGATQRERDEAVAYLTGRFPLRLETNVGMAEILWAVEFYSLGSDYIDRYGDHYRAVTVAQVNEAARKHLHPDRATLIVAGTVSEEPVR